MTELEKAIEWRSDLTRLVKHANDPNYVIEKIKILDYLIENTKENESHLPKRAEVSE